jgi:hypothetical protein
VGEAGGLTLDHTDAGTPVAPRRHLLDASVVESDRRTAFVFGVDLGEFGARPQRCPECPFDHVLVDHSRQPTSLLENLVSDAAAAVTDAHGNTGA